MRKSLITLALASPLAHADIISYNLENFPTYSNVETVTYDTVTGATTGGLQYQQYNQGYELFGSTPGLGGDPPGSFGQQLTGRDATLTLHITPYHWLESYVPDRPGINGLYPWSQGGGVDPVPEPSGLIMLGLGLLTIGMIARRKV